MKGSNESEALTDRRRREKQTKRGYRTLAYRHKYTMLCTNDSNNKVTKEEGEGGQAELGRPSSARPAILPLPPPNSSGEIRHSRLVPRSLTAGCPRPEQLKNLSGQHFGGC